MHRSAHDVAQGFEVGAYAVASVLATALDDARAASAYAAVLQADAAQVRAARRALADRVARVEAAGRAQSAAVSREAEVLRRRFEARLRAR